MTRLNKIMTVSAAEFAASWRAFDASPAPRPGAPARLAVGCGMAEITFEPQQGVKLGGLLELPRAVVTFSFEGVEPTVCAAFVARFDRVYQRGGG